MIGRLVRALAIGPALALLPGCCWLWNPSGPETLVVVVPSRHDGHVGSVVVSKGQDRQVLDTAFATARVKNRGQVHRTALKSEQINQLFAAASAALPRRSLDFTLHFDLANQSVTPESAQKLDQVLTELATWEAAEVEVVGHTDRVGTEQNNEALSLRRAEHVRQLLIERGADPARVRAIGRGERQPVIPTADGVAEAANRRVEVTIR